MSRQRSISSRSHVLRGLAIAGALAALGACSRTVSEPSSPPPKDAGQVGYVSMDRLVKKHPLYGELARIQPSPVVRLNGAVAIGMAEGPCRGLALIDELGRSGELDRYHLYHAARADMLRRLGAFEAAADAYRRALALMANGVERAYLERRLGAL